MIFLFLQLFVYFTYSINTPVTHLPVTHEKYVKYVWEIPMCEMPMCDYNSSLIITKNNVTFLNLSIDKNNRGEQIVIPWCAFTYDPRDIYEWYISYHEHNETVRKTKFNVSKLDTFYATNELNTYEYKTGTRDYALIEIPHFKKSLDKSCLDAEFKIYIWNSEKLHTIKIHNDIDTCEYDHISNSFFAPKFTHIGDHINSANMTIGCLYPGQIGPFDLELGKKYIIEHHFDSYGKFVNLKLQINSYDNKEPYIYYLLALIFGSVLVGIVGIMILTCMYLTYKRCCINEHDFELVVNQDLDDVL